MAAGASARESADKSGQEMLAALFLFAADTGWRENEIARCGHRSMSASGAKNQAAVFSSGRRQGWRRHSPGPSTTAEQIPRPYARDEETLARFTGSSE